MNDPDEYYESGIEIFSDEMDVSNDMYQMELDEEEEYENHEQHDSSKTTGWRMYSPPLPPRRERRAQQKVHDKLARVLTNVHRRRSPSPHPSPHPKLSKMQYGGRFESDHVETTPTAASHSTRTETKKKKLRNR
jgi:hypothetical protein